MRISGKEDDVKLVILDVDGVILDLWANFMPHMKRAAMRCGFPSDVIEPHFDRVRRGEISGESSLERGIRVLWPNKTDELYARFCRFFRKFEREEPYPLIEGSKETTQFLHAQGILVGLCTTNDMETLEHRFHSVGMSLDEFDVIASGDLPCIKPDPRSLTYLLQETGFAAHEAIFVGDWYSDFEAARGAEIDFFACLSGSVRPDVFERLDMRPERILERLSYLIPLIIHSP